MAGAPDFKGVAGRPASIWFYAIGFLAFSFIALWWRLLKPPLKKLTGTCQSGEFNLCKVWENTFYIVFNIYGPLIVVYFVVFFVVLKLRRIAEK